MTTDKHDPENAQTANVSRRDFIARSVAAGLVAATGQALAATLAVVETEVTVTTPARKYRGARDSVAHPVGRPLVTPSQADSSGRT